MVCAFVAGQAESSLFGALDELARARCRRVNLTGMHTEPCAADLADHWKFGLAYHLYDSLKVPEEEDADTAAAGVWHCAP